MSEPTLALQGALLVTLKSETDAGGAVFDVLTPNTFPRIQIGAGDAVPNDAECVDGFDVTIQIDVWSNAKGYREVKTIAGQIHGLLHKQSIGVPGYRVVDIYSDGAVFSREGDISRARIQISAQLEAV